MNSELKKLSIKYGLIGFAIYFIAFFIMWKVDLSLFLNPLVTYPLAISVFVLGIVSQKKLKDLSGGYLSFGNALLCLFITIAIGFLGYLIAGILIFNVIDPAAKETIMDLSIKMALEATEKMMSLFGMDNSLAPQISEDQLRQSMKMGPEPLGIANLIIGYITNLALFTVGGLISSLIIKKDKPYEFE